MKSTNLSFLLATIILGGCATGPFGSNSIETEEVSENKQPKNISSYFNSLGSIFKSAEERELEALINKGQWKEAESLYARSFLENSASAKPLIERLAKGLVRLHESTLNEPLSKLNGIESSGIQPQNYHLIRELTAQVRAFLLEVKTSPVLSQSSYRPNALERDAENAIAKSDTFLRRIAATQFAAYDHGQEKSFFDAYPAQLSDQEREAVVSNYLKRIKLDSQSFQVASNTVKSLGKYIKSQEQKTAIAKQLLASYENENKGAGFSLSKQLLVEQQLNEWMPNHGTGLRVAIARLEDWGSLKDKELIEESRKVTLPRFQTLQQILAADALEPWQAGNLNASIASARKNGFDMVILINEKGKAYLSSEGIVSRGRNVARYKVGNDVKENPRRLELRRQLIEAQNRLSKAEIRLAEGYQNMNQLRNTNMAGMSSGLAVFGTTMVAAAVASMKTDVDTAQQKVFQIQQELAGTPSTIEVEAYENYYQPTVTHQYASVIPHSIYAIDLRRNRFSSFKDLKFDKQERTIIVECHPNDESCEATPLDPINLISFEKLNTLSNELPSNFISRIKAAESLDSSDSKPLTGLSRSIQLEMKDLTTYEKAEGNILRKMLQ